MSDNQLSLVAVVLEIGQMRYTPAGIPALDMVLEHASSQEEAGSLRQVKLQIKTVAFAHVAESLAKTAIGRSAKFNGFLAASRGGKGVSFHLQSFQFIDKV